MQRLLPALTAALVTTVLVVPTASAAGSSSPTEPPETAVVRSLEEGLGDGSSDVAAAATEESASGSAVAIDLGGDGRDLAHDAVAGLVYVSVPSRNEVVVVDVAARAVVDRIVVGSQPNGIDLSDDRSVLYVALGSDMAVAHVDTTTRTVVGRVDVGPALRDGPAWDVAEVEGRILVTANPYSYGLSYVVAYDPATTEPPRRVANNSFIRASPIIVEDPTGRYAYVGEGFSPNSVYKLDMAQADGPIVKQDDHGSVSGTTHMAIAPAGDRLFTSTGQILGTGSFDVRGRIGAGPSTLSLDGAKALVLTTVDGVATLERWDTATLRRTGAFPLPCSATSASTLRLVESDATVAALTPGRLCLADLPAEDEAVVSGSIRDASRPVAEVCIDVWTTTGIAEGAPPVAGGVSDELGRFWFSVPAGDTYVAMAWDCLDGYYEYEWYADAASASEATPLRPQAWYDTDISMTLRSAGEVAGQVVDATWGRPLEGIEVEAFDGDGAPTPWYAVTDAEGRYAIPSLRGGADYSIRFSDPSGRYDTRWFDGAESYATAEPVTAESDMVVLGIDGALPDPAGPVFPSAISVEDGWWQLRHEHTTGEPDDGWAYGRAGDVPVTGDWDGDGVPTAGVYRNGRWYLRDGGPGTPSLSFFYGGRSGDIPVVGDWDGDGDDNVGIIRDGRWHLVESHRGGVADISFTYGRIGPRGADIPLVGDWDGHGGDEIGIVRDGEWHLRNQLGGGQADERFTYGRVGPRGDDIAVVGDWDGDGQDTVGVVRGRSWFLRNALAGGDADETFDFGGFSGWKLPLGGFGETTQQRLHTR